MSIYNKISANVGLTPISKPTTLPGEGVDIGSRHNYLTIANAVELTTEIIADLAKKTDALTVEIDDRKLLRRDIAASVVRSLETRIDAVLQTETA